MGYFYPYMDPITPKLLARMCQALLRPVASLLLKCGLTWREFSQISKAVFVEVASDEYGINGRQTNISRVSLLTGISRKEVKRQRELLAAEAPDKTAFAKTTDATRLLSSWHQDPAFSDGKGHALPLSDELFEDLFARHGGDVPASAILKELRRVGAVQRDAHGDLVATSRYYMPTRFDSEWLRSAGSYLEDLGCAINFNLSAEPEQRTRFVGRATEPHVDPAVADEFHDFINEQGQQFLERVDDWLARYPAAPAGAQGTRLGVGLFLIDNESTA